MLESIQGLTAEAGSKFTSSVYQNPDYERFDTIGFNYRMNAITASIGFAQFERIQELVERRKKVGNLFLEAVNGCDWIETQEIPSHSEHSYFTFGLLYEGSEMRGVSWKSFYDRYKSIGGDGFYACWKPPYMEPSLKGKELNGQVFDSGLCPIAEDYQKKIMAFKSNYRDIKEAEFRGGLLRKLISEINNK